MGLRGIDRALLRSDYARARMSLRKRLAEGTALAALLFLATGCSSSTSSPPPTAGDGGDEAEAGPSLPDVDVDGPLSAEGCEPGQSCDCVLAVSVCRGGPRAPRSCNMPLDCEPNVQSQDMLCVATDDGGPRVCARRCAKTGGCGGASCPGGYVC